MTRRSCPYGNCADSDIDLVVRFEPGGSLFDLMDLEQELSALLDRPVDVISLGGLKDRVERIRQDMRPL